MSQPLLLTLMSAGRSYSSSFDETTQSLLWISDSVVAREENALARVEFTDEGSMLVPGRGCEIVSMDGTPVERGRLDAETRTVFSLNAPRLDAPAILYVRPSSEKIRSYVKLGFSCDADIVIGREDGCEFFYDRPLVSSNHARLSLVGETFAIEDLESSNGTTLNGEILEPGRRVTLVPGDVVQILDLVFMIGQRFIIMNEPEGLEVRPIEGAAYLDHEAFKEACPPATEDTDEPPLFYPAPRLSRGVHAPAIQVDEPPAPKKKDKKPAIMQLGPSFLMGIASLCMVASAVSRLMNGADVMTTVPMIAMSISMVAGMVIWPIISKKYEKKNDAAEESKRQSSYTDYLNSVEARFAKECVEQEEILHENRVTVESLEEAASVLSPTLMNRSAVHEDFLELRVGMGDAELQADVRWPSHGFTLERDPLLGKVDALAANPPKLHDVPLAVDIADNYNAGIIGEWDEVWAFARGLIVQLCSLYSYQDLKIILLANEADEAEWGFIRSLAHVMDPTGKARFIATTREAATEISLMIMRELDVRTEQKVDILSDYGCYYVVICASNTLAESCEAISALAKLRKNRGFSLLYLGRRLSDLPRECGYVMDLDNTIVSDEDLKHRDDDDADEDETPRQSRMFAQNDISGTRQAFDPDIFVSAGEAERFALDIVRVHLDSPEERTALPGSVGFMEMFQVGTTAQLDIPHRWSEADASRTLATPLGIDPQGEYAILNLHEKVHGPHGLIAGTTGSGKSEFIITYVLSMCLNYPPDQVAFVLIDYKGGGLAGAFENERFHLPHLSGTITNLDGAAITRSLTSIKSELKRRQDVLNKARDITGEATVDIYKYLSYYRQGVLTEPLPHLFIVADEFAELKQQEPEFMDELVSAARIGRSLGVHLILATQKPTGVVNDQILSNSRFKICLKVADAADSKEMIRRPDAAEIDRPGCFYMLIGYNEQFSNGQAAYAGGSYTPSDHFEPKVDNTVELIDVGGNVIAAAKPPSTAKKSDTSELNAVLAEIERAANVVGKKAPMLWLDPLADHIVADELLEKYPHSSKPFVLDPVIGELDDPEKQEQRPLDMPINDGGNVIIYGSPDSGIESLVLTMLYEMCEEQDAKHLNIYIFDFGSEAMTSMRAYPQVGDVILAADEEKVARTLTMLEKELAERRALFSEYGGSYERYCDEHDDRPAIFVVLNGIAVFNELYEDHFMRLVVIAREGLRAGIFMCVTASTGNDARMRLRACFKQTLVLMLNDSTDYVSVLGSMRGVPEPSGDCRGLIKLDDTLYIFQGAHVAAEGEDDFARLQKRGAELSEKSEVFAPPVPMLPKVVTADILRGRKIALPEIPIGIFEGDLTTAVLELSERTMERCVFSKTKDGVAFITSLVRMLADDGAVHPVLFDTAKLMHELPGICETESQDPEELVTFLQNLVLQSVKGNADPSQVIFISGIASTLTHANSQIVSPVREYLKTRRVGEGPAFVLFDNAVDCSYGPEEWFKMQIGTRDGVWVGEGVDAQNTIQIGYTPGGEKPDASVKGARGYVVRAGKIQRVKLLSEAKEEEKEG